MLVVVDVTTGATVAIGVAALLNAPVVTTTVSGPPMFGNAERRRRCSRDNADCAIVECNRIVSVR